MVELDSTKGISWGFLFVSSALSNHVVYISKTSNFKQPKFFKHKESC